MLGNSYITVFFFLFLTQVLILLNVGDDASVTDMGSKDTHINLIGDW